MQCCARKRSDMQLNATKCEEIQLNARILNEMEGNAMKREKRMECEGMRGNATKCK